MFSLLRASTLPLLALSLLGVTAPRLYAQGAIAPLQVRVSIARGVDAMRALTLAGKQFTPGSPVLLESSMVPNTLAPMPFAPLVADGAGGFVVRVAFACTTHTADDGLREMTFTALDVASGRRVIMRETAAPWVCLTPAPAARP